MSLNTDIMKVRQIECMGSKKKDTILTKKIIPSMMSGVYFVKYDEQVLQDSKDTYSNIFNLLMRDYNRLKYLLENFHRTNYDKKHKEGMSVTKTSKVLREKFAKSFAVKTKIMIKDIINLMNIKEYDFIEYYAKFSTVL